MPVSIACPTCGTPLSIPKHLIGSGKTLRCSGCQKSIVLSAAVAPIAPAADTSRSPGARDDGVQSPSAPLPSWMEPAVLSDATPGRRRPPPPDPEDELYEAEVAREHPRPRRRRSGRVTSDDRTTAMFCHLSGTVTGFIGPLILWLLKKDESRFVDHHGRTALNFALTLLIAHLVAGVGGFLFGIVTCGLGVFLIVPLVLAVLVLGWVFWIIGAVKASHGEWYTQPLALRFIPDAGSGPGEVRRRRPGEEPEAIVIDDDWEGPVPRPRGRPDEEGDRRGVPFWVWLVGGVGVVVVLGVVGVVAYFATRHHGSLDNLAQVKPGMTLEEVMELLGPPSSQVAVNLPGLDGKLHRREVVTWQESGRGGVRSVTYTFVDGRLLDLSQPPPILAGGAPPQPPVAAGGAPPQPPVRPVPQPPDDAIARDLTDLKSADQFTRMRAADDLARQPVAGQRRPEVSRALEGLLNDPNPLVTQAGLRALAVWATRDSVPALLRALRRRELIGPVLEVLGKLKDPRVAFRVAGLLRAPLHRRDAANCLRAIGPLAEPAVRPHLHNPDWQVRLEACKILQAIGTRASVPALKELSGDTHRFVAEAAQDALDAIENQK